jgi:predicted RNA-binding Zn-ribbon protein involved in translation (DUF1610 family)
MNGHDHPKLPPPSSPWKSVPLWIFTVIATLPLWLLEPFLQLYPDLWHTISTPWGTLIMKSSGFQLFLLGTIPFAFGIVLALPMVFVARRWEQRFRRYWRWQTHRCIQCDYDLRAHHAGDQCPECASVIPPEPPPPRPPKKPISSWRCAIQSIVLLSVITILAIINGQHPVIETDEFAFFVALPCVFFVALGISRLQRYQRWKLNKCMHCGHDLRPQTPGQLCPNCGMTIPAPPMVQESNASSSSPQ